MRDRRPAITVNDWASKRVTYLCLKGGELEPQARLPLGADVREKGEGTRRSKFTPNKVPKGGGG